jgi:predicted house-cleaning noncanonical NTP pyrophosphatase (MazG superfamily)
MLEVIYTLAELRHASPEQLEDIRRTKRTERGGFDSHLLLESVT